MIRPIVKVLVVIILLIGIHSHTSGHILIDIEPDELQRLGEILVETYLEQNTILHSRSSVNISRCKKIIQNAAQLFGIMFSLVGANLLTNTLQPLTMVNTPMHENTAAFTPHATFVPSEICKHEFGCDQNLCWRSCDNGFNASQSWCFTAPKIEAKNLQICSFSYECSPCWDCLGSCKSNTSKT